jgi:phosphatidate cytidylyltransferase
MRDRLIFGPILIAVIIGLAWLDDFLDRTPAPEWWPEWLTEAGTCPPGLVLLPLIFGLAMVACRELSNLLRRKGIQAGSNTLALCSVLGFACWLLPQLPYAWTSAPALTPTLAAAALVVGMVSFLRRRTPDGVLAAAAAALLAFVYLGLLPGFLLAIRIETGVWVLLWIVLVVKSCDIGALFTGKAIGRHKLIPWLSPGKTWEGLLGGMLTASVVAVLGAGAVASLGQQIPWSVLMMALAGAAGGGLGQLGDLVKSSFKRDAAVKDSGSVIPGMGGVIDVIDSPLFVAPFAYWAFLCTGR